MPQAPKKPLSETVRTIGALSTVGFSFVLAIVIGAWLGWLLDKRLGTTPWMFFVVLRAGAGGGRAERVSDVEPLPEMNGR